jgi:hypothetical protein
VRKFIIGGIGLALGAAVSLAPWATAGGNGAARSGLSVVQPASNDSQCQQGSGAGSNGFAIFNAPGKPGATIKFNGEVSLKRGAPNTLYNVYLVPDGGDCTMPAGMIMTNGQGNGNTHLMQAGPGAGTYYIVLQDAMGNEQFATGQVTIV